MFRVLITGSTGQVGSELVKMAPAGFRVLSYNSSELDITDAYQVHRVIAEQAPALIMNAAAYTAVDKAESDTERAYAVNEVGVKNLAHAALTLDIPVFHISTDYVFDGAATVPYKETDPVRPISVYGLSKIGGERALVESGVKHIILRTSWIFGLEGNNFLKTMLRLGRARDSLSVVEDQYGCPTSAASIARVLWQLAQKFTEESKFFWGIYNFSNEPATNWHGFACEIFKQAAEVGLLEKVPVVNAIKAAAHTTVANRPAWSVLDCSALEGLLEQKVPSWRRELSAVMEQLK